MGKSQFSVVSTVYQMGATVASVPLPQLERNAIPDTGAIGRLCPFVVAAVGAAVGLRLFVHSRWSLEVHRAAAAASS